MMTWEFPEGTEGKKRAAFWMKCVPYGAPTIRGRLARNCIIPDSARIQHAGIVNLRLEAGTQAAIQRGSYELLLRLEPGKRNVIAVTEPVLPWKKKFLEAGDFGRASGSI